MNNPITGATHSMFDAADGTIARITLGTTAVSRYRLPDSLDDSAALRAYLDAVAQDSVAREAIAVSSRWLDATLDRVHDGRAIKASQLRSAALSVARYLNRMSRRPTPFGIMAGVTAVRIGDCAQFAMGDRHTKLVSPSSEWLVNALLDLFVDPDFLVAGPHLDTIHVVANDLCRRRGRRIVLPALLRTRRHRDSGPERTERRTRLTEAALDHARRPCCLHDLIDHLVDTHPDVSVDAVRATLTRLLAGGFLLVDIVPPAHEPDPLGHVLRHLPDLGNARLGHARREFAAVAASTERYAGQPPGEGWAGLRETITELDRVAATDRPLRVDLRLDATVGLPLAVAHEFAAAASAAWRIHPPRAHPLEGYRSAFLDRYGLHGRVPLAELTDPGRGLGPPPGPHARAAGGAERAAPHVAERHEILCAIAQQAAATGQREVLLTDEHIDALATDQGPAGYIELCARLLANSLGDIDDGNFRLVLSAVKYSRPGALFARFLPALPELREPFSRTLSTLTDAWRTAEAVQLTGVTIDAADLDVTRTSRLRPTRICVGEFADPDDPRTLRVDDLIVGVEHDRMFVLSGRTGREVVPLTFHGLQMRGSTPDALRLLFHIGSYRTPSWDMWNWGAVAAKLPYLPRITHGRTVLAPARWRVPAALADATGSPSHWHRQLATWRKEFDVPQQVELTRGDQILALDLDSPADLHLLRDDLVRHPHDSQVTERPYDGAHGTAWAGGRAVELAVSLVPRELSDRAPVRTQLPLPVAVDPARTRVQHLPGGCWLDLRLHAEKAVHDDLLADYLPNLVDGLGDRTDRWFFIRYHDPAPHLRVRFHGQPADLNGRVLPLVHDWAAGCVRDGVLGELAISTYCPEICRYGGPAAMADAERLFCADSVASLRQLALLRQGQLDIPLPYLLVANYFHFAKHFYGEDWRTALLDLFPKGPHHRAFRSRSQEAVRLLDPDNPDNILAAPGSHLLTAIWATQLRAIAAYGTTIRALTDGGELKVANGPFRGVLHMHHNRLAGDDEKSEHDSYAIARGVLQALADRAQHKSRSQLRRGGPAGPRSH